MAPYIEAIDSQHSFYFTVSRQKSTTYICLKIRLFCTTQTIFLMHKVFIFLIVCLDRYF